MCVWASVCGWVCVVFVEVCGCGCGCVCVCEPVYEMKVEESVLKR